MKLLTPLIPATLLGFLVSALLVAQQGPAQQKPAVPQAFRSFRFPPSAPLRFLASEEGRSFLKATGHPLAAPAIRAFGEPAKTAVIPQAWLEDFASAAQPDAPESFSCGGVAGARFNLEPRASAAPQNQASADFLLNRIGPNEDLIVQSANDWRGNLKPPTQWDQSVSGYYVHRSAAADCSAQLEGGLPAFTAQGNTEMGIGNSVVAADPRRDAFFIADARFGSANLGGIALFRASASRLLNATACPSGTHTQAQAASCWMETAPAFLFAQPVFDSVGDLPRIAVDERPTSAGVGAGNVYVVIAEFDFNSQTSKIALATCSNALSCASPVFASGTNTATGFPDVQVRADGEITVSFVTSNADGSTTVMYNTCKPAAVPNPPVCGTPTTVAQVPHPLLPSNDFSVTTPMTNINLTAWTFPKHVSRAEVGGKFTSFMAYEDCKNPFQFLNPPVTVCLNAEVVMAHSVDNGKTWTAPTSVNTSTGHHFFPAIATDASTGVVHLSYYSAAGDKFNHAVQVLRNQIAPGTTAVGTPTAVTTVHDPIDSDPQILGFFLSDIYMGIVARGTGVTGQSHLYTSFDSTVISGAYEGEPDKELNNHLGMILY